MSSCFPCSHTQVTNNLKSSSNRLQTNVHDDGSPLGTGGSNPTYYKSLNLNQDQSHYYSSIQDEIGTPSTHVKQRATPSAPLIEGSSTEAQEGHEYFVLEQQSSLQSTEQVGGHTKANSNESFDELSGEHYSAQEQDAHNYFVLEQATGNHDDDGSENESDGTTSKPDGVESEGYDHIRRLPEKNPVDSNYSHLSPNSESGYDHLARPGKTWPIEDAAVTN